MSVVPPDALAYHFVEKDSELKEKKQEIAPVMKERKELYDSLKKLMASEPDPARRFITLPNGVVLRLKSKESPTPMNQEYLAAKLATTLRLPEAQAADVARVIFEERPTKTTFTIVQEGGGSSSEGAGSAARGAGAKRRRQGAHE
jgi:hypothetical protein